MALRTFALFETSMLSIHDTGSRLCDGITRREWLRLGGLSAFGLSLPNLLASQASASVQPSGGRARNCIVLFLLGGPPQHETWDPKPDAPKEIRGPFAPIATNVPGIHVGELMPRTAKLLDKICVLRSLSTNDNAHSSSGYWMLTGVPHQPKNSENAKPGAPNNWPCFAAIVQRLRQSRGGLPASVRLPEHIWNTGGIVWPGQDAGFLGRSANPWLLYCDPSSPKFEIPGLALPEEVTSSRLQNRLSLLGRVDRGLDNIDARGNLGAFDAQTQKAFDLLQAGSARRAFDLSHEPEKLRERYGRNRFGQSVLLARRLIEAGVSLVQVNWTRMPGDTKDSPAWDTHAKNADRLKNHLMPIMDLAYSALLEDLEARGLLDETLLVWAGEFGRTPKINGRDGRDHWGHVFSAALAGGGIRGGQVLGSSDSRGGYPRDGRIEPQDLTATLFHCLGYRPETEMHDSLGRPIPISRGTVLHKAF